jgi:zinc/manganese transport system substrate-binding protein
VRRLLAGLAVGALLLSGCGGNSGKASTTTTPASKKLSIVVTTTQLADWVNVLTGGQDTVYSVLKPGVDPHSYKLTAPDINAIATADLIIKNGAGLEPWFDSTISSTDHTGTVIDASSGVTVRPSADPNSSVGDPHIWMSLANAKVMVQNIDKALDSADPTDKNAYDSATRAYDAQVDGLINTGNQAFGALNDKFVVTDHEAYDYFCAEFNLQCIASVTPTSGSSTAPTSDQIVAVANTLKDQNVKTVFAQANGSPSVAEELATDVGVPVSEGEAGLYGDSLGAAGGDADTYLKAMTHDVNAIVAGLH